MNIPKLKRKMKEKGYNVDRLAAEIPCDRTTLYRKLNRAEKFTVGEVQSIKRVLGLTNEEATLIFLK